MEETIVAIKFLIGLFFLLYATKLDFESRIVPNRIWKAMLATLFPLTIIETLLYHLSFLELIFAFFQAFFVIGISYIFYHFGLYGGADAKAIMVLSILFPFYPSLANLPLLAKGFSYAFSSLANAVMFAPLLSLYFFLTNLKREGIREFRESKLYYFIGIRIGAKKIPRHYSLLEFPDEGGEIKRVRRGVELDGKMKERLERAINEGKIDRIWITPQIPFMFFITAGYIIAFVLGDVLTYLLINATLR